MHRHCCRTHDDYLALVNSPAFTIRWMLERHLATVNAGRRSFTLPGVCTSCVSAVDFVVALDGAWESPDGLLVPNWRDYLRCPQCQLNGRQRAVAGLITEWACDAPNKDTLTAYMMEQVSPLHAWALRTVPWVGWTGSEYLGPNRVGGTPVDGVRHENAEALSFADSSFDLVVSCDVLEHVNDPVAAFREIARVLRPGGTAILTFPMDPNLDDNQRRAEIADGRVRHLMPAVYHGNPLSPKGSLVFTDFGWEVLGQLAAAGLPDASLTVYWAYELGYLGIQFYFSAHASG